MTTTILAAVFLALTLPGGPADGPAAEGPGLPPPPAMKNPQAQDKLKEGLAKFQAEDYDGARSILNGCLKESATPADRKALQGLIDDTRLGMEIQAARKFLEQKNEKKALAKVEAALKANPGSSLAPAARKFIQEVEEILYCILDDFETEEGAAGSPAGAGPGRGSGKKAEPLDLGAEPRLRAGMSVNTDPRFVLHGKGSLKWDATGRKISGKGRGGPGGPGGPGRRQDLTGYCSAQLKTPLKGQKWRQLVFSVYLPESEEGALQVTLSPTTDAPISDSLYAEKLVDLRGKRGWLPVRIDLASDFGNTKTVHLQDVRFFRIEYFHTNSRTLYLDFIHLE